MQKLYQPRSILMNKEVDLWELDDAGHWPHDMTARSSATALSPVSAARLEMRFLRAAQRLAGEGVNGRATAEWTGFLLAGLNVMWKGL